MATSFDWTQVRFLRQLSQWLNGSTTEGTANGTDFSESTVARQINEANDYIPIIAFCYFEIKKYSIVLFRGASALKIEQAEHFGQNLPFHSKISSVILLIVCHTTFIDASSENFVLNQLMIPWFEFSFILNTFPSDVVLTLQTTGKSENYLKHNTDATRQRIDLCLFLVFDAPDLLPLTNALPKRS